MMAPLAQTVPRQSRDAAAAGLPPLIRPDPAVRLVCAAILSVCMALLARPSAAAAALGCAVALLALFRPAWGKTGRRLIAVNAFLALVWLFTPFTTPGAPLGRFLGLAPTRQGVELALLVTLKANAIVLVFMALVAPLGPTALARAMKRLHCPEKLVWLILLMGRNIELLRGEWRRLDEAARLRGFAPRSSLHAWRVFGALFGLLFVRAHDRGRRSLEAMRLRGFNGRLPLTGGSFRPVLSDALPGALAIALAAALILAERL